MPLGSADLGDLDPECDKQLYAAPMRSPTASVLRTLDDALTGLRRVWLHPGRRRRFLAELGEPVELAVLRTLRAIELVGGTRSVVGSDPGASDAPGASDEPGVREEPGVSDVAAALAVKTSTASRLVEDAVAQGYVTRVASEVDRRRAVLRLTPEGARLLDRATAVRASLLAEVTADWSREDVATLARLLERLQRDFARLDR